MTPHAAVLRPHTTAILAHLRLLGFARVLLPIDETTTVGPESAPRCIFDDVMTVRVGGRRLFVTGWSAHRLRGRWYWRVTLSPRGPTAQELSRCS